MSTEMTWEQAVLHVLKNASEPMYYGDIAEKILVDGLKTTGGKTPNATVAAVISRLPPDADIVKVNPGVFQWRPGDGLDDNQGEPRQSKELDAIDASDSKNISVAAYGLHWERNKVDWSARRLYGYDIQESETIDFANQQGVYLLHSWQSIVYVGKTSAKEGGLFQRLNYHHTRQVWSGKWERFSWFGIRRVIDNGVIVDDQNYATKEVVTALMEAVLIEALRPAFNDQKGNYMGTLYRQATDPNVAIANARAVLAPLTGS